MVLDQKWVVNSISDVKMEFRHIWSLNATIFESVDKNGFSHFSRALWNFKCDDLLIHVTQASYHWKVWRLSFHWKKKIMSTDKNSSKTKEIKFWNFSNFFKKKEIFSNFENPLKKTAPGVVFFWKVHSTSKLFRIASNHFQNFLKVSLERFDFTLNDFETLNATI